MNLSDISFPKDPHMQMLFDRYKSETLLVTSKNPFHALVESIISQQLSTKAAETIYTRFLARIADHEYTPEALQKVPVESLRSVGMSWSKAQYIKNIAQGVIDKKLDFSKYQQKTDEEIIQELTSIKGIGRWTAEMFLMFTLGRPDVMSYSDIGIQNAIQKLYTLQLKPSKGQMQRLSHRWKPYRTFACKVLWRSIDAK